MKHRTLFCIVLAVVAVPAFTQNDGIPPIGTIEIYGNRTLTNQQVRDALNFTEGDYALPQLDSTLGPRLARAMGAARVQLDGTCCDNDGNVLVFVGIDEAGTANLAFRPTPTGSVRLPGEIYDTFLRFNSAVREASLSSNPTEDLSQGHSLITDEKARKEQEKFLGFASSQLAILKRVLAESSDRNHRAAAAYVMGYAEDKSSVVDDLVAAALDPDSSVRTNATRALTAIATLAAAQPQLGIRIPPEPFIDMVNSIVYADRQMGVRVLRRLSAARDPEVLNQIRQGALLSIVEMARWGYTGHAWAPYQIVGRMAGLNEDEIETSFYEDREPAIQKVLDSRNDSP